MSLIDLMLLGVMALASLKSGQAYRRSRGLASIKNMAAFMLALLLHPYASSLLATTNLPARMEGVLDVVITLPAGPGTEVARGLMWLTEADLPEAITRAIREVWLRDTSADVEALTLAARRVLAKAVLNLATFIVLFLMVRWLLNLVSINVVKALPSSLARGNRVLGLILGLAQSIAVCAILVAIVAPLLMTGLLPPLLAEHLRHSRLADFLLSILHHLNLYRL